MRPDDLRAATAERAAAIAALGQHFAEGRLSVTEYGQRVGAAAEALVRKELRALFDDLPPPGPPLAPPIGHLPEPLRATLAAEGVLLLAGRVPGSITYRRFRAPGEYHRWRKVAVVGTVALTGRRLVVWAGRGKQVDVPYGHPLRSAITLVAERPDRLCIAYDAAAFNAQRSGRVELRFRSEHAPAMADLFGRSRSA